MQDENTEGASDSDGGSRVAHPGRSRFHAGYWKSRIFHRTKAGYASPEWSVRLQHEGKRETFSLFTATAKDAADTAREIAVHLEANGWESTLAKYKRRGARTARGTLGEFLEGVRGRSTLKAATFKGYSDRLRHVVSWIARIPAGPARFDYVGGGAGAWREKVHAVPLAVLTPAAIHAWRADYLERAGDDQVKRKAAERSLASIVRQARCLFRDAPLNPFDGIKLKTPPARRYQSAVDPAELLRAAEAELKLPHPQQYLALVLCLFAGLRKKEADLLTWPQVDLAAGTIRIQRTAYFEPKTEESQRDIDIPPACVEILKAYRGGPDRFFVLRGGPPKPGAIWGYYRASKTWTKLLAWLRGMGITERKAIHALRKESGSLIAAQFGIEAARAHLGHRDIQTTSAHYVGKKGRREVTL